MSENGDDVLLFVGVLLFFVVLFLLVVFFYFVEVTWHPKFPFCLAAKALGMRTLAVWS